MASEQDLRLLHELQDEQLVLRDAMRESVARFLAGEDNEESDQAGSGLKESLPARTSQQLARRHGGL